MYRKWCRKIIKGKYISGEGYRGVLSCKASIGKAMEGQHTRLIYPAGCSVADTLSYSISYCIKEFLCACTSTAAPARVFQQCIS